jgi:hypothetical protein
MKNAFLFSIHVIIPIIAFGQHNFKSTMQKKNTIYIELLGQGVFYSIAFNHLINVDKKIKNSFTIGATFFPSFQDGNLFVMGIPASYCWLLAKNKNYLELGGGLTVITINQPTLAPYDSLGVKTNYSYLFCSPKIAYRFQNINGGFFFRASLDFPIPLIDRNGKIKKGTKVHQEPNFNYFPHTLGYWDALIFVWPGISVGYTF